MASLYRKAAFIAIGLSSFTQSAYIKRSSSFEPLDHIDLTGRAALVTGANSGLGYALAKKWAQQKGTVHLVVRSREKGEEAKQQIIRELKELAASSSSSSSSSSSAPSSSSSASSSASPSSLSKASTSSSAIRSLPVNAVITTTPDIHVHVLDLSSVSAVKAFTSQWQKKPLQILFNNAGAMIHGKKKTEEGFEANFATNVLGTYLLTEGLKDALRSSSSAQFLSRVITVSSGGALTQDLRLDDLECLKEGFQETTSSSSSSSSSSPPLADATYVYAHNKRAQISLTEYWDKLETSLYANQPRVQFHVMHPGWAETQGVITSMPDFHRQMKGLWRTPEQGIDTAFWLGSSPRASLYPPAIPSGLFWLDRKPVPTIISFAMYKGLDEKSSETLAKILYERSKDIQPTPEQLAKYEYLRESEA